MSYDSLKSAAVAAAAKARGSAQAAALATQNAEDLQAQAVSDAAAVTAAVLLIQPDPVVPPPIVPPVITVTSLKAVPSAQGTVAVSWTPPIPPPDTYTVGRDGVQADGTGANWSGTVDGAATSQTFDKLKDGTAYTFTVTPAGGVASSVSVTTLPAVTPAASGAQTGWVDTVPLGYVGTAKLLTSWSAASGALPANASRNRSRSGPADAGVSGPFNPPNADGSGENACFAPAMVRIQDGALILSVQKNSTGKYTTLAYEAGCVNFFDIPWGDNTALEAMLWMADGAGLWPAWWGWPNRSYTGSYLEIDMIEKWENGDFTDNDHDPGNYPGHPATWGPTDVGGRWVRVLFTRKGGKMSPYADGKLYPEGVMNKTHAVNYDLCLNVAVINSRIPVLGDAVRLGWWKLYSI